MMGLLALSVGCGDCTGGKGKIARGETEGVTVGSVTDFLARQASTPPDLQSFLLIGEEDEANRFPFTVAVYALAPPGQPRYRGCAGVLLTRQLVLTAGQCVCRPHKDGGPGSGETTRIDTSSCAATAAVVTATYEPLENRKGVESWSVEYRGTVRVHPQFELRMDAAGAITGDHADLAVVRLDTPVQPNIEPVRLADGIAQAGERLTVVGHGYIDPTDGLDGRRRFTHDTVSQLLDPDGARVQFGSPELFSYKGDTGGPCLRETAQGLELLGISNRGSGKPPAFTSTYVYREWLANELHLAASESPP
ncbi:MAG: trypsin-like serine protease [Hyalangium sp.]|uniref:trypsin-like serine protease n=1 Tax=Hyalangium sp. TaxID=2028555 RepID=UPI003899CA5E